MPIGRLAMHVACLPQFLTSILTMPSLDMATHKFPDLKFTSTANLLSELDRTSKEARSKLAAATEEELHHSWKLSLGDRVFVEGPRMVLYRTMFLNHLVHHRAQLGVYLRLLNVAVPGLYGPSADEPM